MPSSFGHPARRAIGVLVAALAALALLPVVAHAAQPATLRLLGSDPEYRAVQLTATDGARVTAAPGLFRLRITPAGGPAVERRGFCADAHHAIDEGITYNVSLRTEADEALLTSPRYGEAAWLIQQAEALVAAAPSGARALEAGAIQVAVWQLTDQIRETTPTNDALLNARAAAVRALASGRAVGGPVTITHADARGCAGRGAVPLRITGRPGSTASLAASGGGVVSPSAVRFDATGVASASVTSAVPGAVTVTASADGGTLTRAARSTAGASTPQETVFLVPGAFSAATAVTFDDCPVIPLDTTPAAPLAPDAARVSPLGKPSYPAVSIPGTQAPRRSNQSSPTFTVTKTGPAAAVAGGTATYRILVRNRGTAPLAGLALADDLPEGMSLARLPSGARLRAGRLQWSMAPLSAGRARVFTVTVRLDHGISGRRCNRATVTRAGSSAIARASACTRITSRPRVLRPAVAA